MLQLFGGLKFELVAQGDSDGFSFPVSTGAFDQAKHICLMEPAQGGGGGSVGGYYSWNGSQISSGSWGSGISNPFSVGTWKVLEIKGLSAPIQHLAPTIAPNYPGAFNNDLAISPLVDYTKAKAFSCCFGMAQNSGNACYVSWLRQILVGNSTLRRRYATAWVNGTIPTITVPAIIIPGK